MRKIIIGLLLSCHILAYSQEEMLTPFYHCYEDTITRTQCGTANSSNFPLLVNVTFSALESVANGGNVTSTGTNASGNTQPNDVEFSLYQDFHSLLNWEVEYYNSSTGNLIAWVKLPTLNYNALNVLYMGVGNWSITSFQGGSQGSVWNSNYKAIYHLPNGTTLSGTDYTSNALNLTISSATATTGEIDGGASMASASSAYLYYTSFDASIPANFTMSAWINATTYPNSYQGIDLSTSGGFFDIWIKSNGKMAVYTTSGDYDGGSNTMSTGTWYYVAATCNGSTVIGYINAAQDGTYSGSGTISQTSSLSIGHWSGGDRYWNGKMDEVRIMYATETPSQITSEYNNQKPSSTFNNFFTAW